MNPSSQNPNRTRQRGQVVILMTVAMVVLLLFAGLAIDVASAYVVRARLSKAVDAACLTGMRNLALGQVTAGQLAQNSFTANYGSFGDVAPPVLNIVFTHNATGQTQITITATAIMKTVFMGIFPAARTLTIGNTAQALRGTLVMSLVLDRSDSMNLNGGATALKYAVPNFTVDFSTTDYLAMVSFASDATTDQAMNTNNISNINGKVGTLNFTGGTFGPGGVTLAKAQEDNTNPPGNVVKVVVYFTDGYVNTIQDTLPCVYSGGNHPTLYNFGGYDSGSNAHFFVPQNVPGTPSGTDLQGLDGNNYPPAMPPASHDCSPVTTFTSQNGGSQKSFTANNIAPEARYRALQTTTAMLNEGITVYSIGLGHQVDTAFLQQIANDPASSSYNPALPQGMAVFAPDCPSSTCTQELNTVFQTIASKILLRLTQ